MEYLLAFVLLPIDSDIALYAMLFSILILSGVGLPVPEEVTLLIGGYLAYLGLLDFRITVYTLVLGILVADMGGYLVGRFAGDMVSKKISRMRYVPYFLKKAEKYFTRHGEKMVLLSRPLFGIRVAVPILAGHFKMNFLKFLAYDALAAIPWTIFLTWLSFYLGTGFNLIFEFREIKYGVYLFSLAALFFWLVFKYAKYTKAKREGRVETFLESIEEV